MPLETGEERRAAIRGYVMGIFRVGHFMGGVFPEGSPDLDFTLYDGDRLSPETLMYTTDPPGRSPEDKGRPLFSSQKTLDLYGRRWTLTFASRPALEAFLDRYTGKGILGAGMLIGFLAFLSLWTLERTGRRAFSLARHMTEALRESEEKYRVLNDNLSVGVALIGPDMTVLAANVTQRKWFPGADPGRRLPCYAVFDSPPRREPCEGCPAIPTFADGKRHEAQRESETARGKRILQIRTAPILDEAGKVVSVHATVEDVTRQREAEQDRIARQAAEEASRQKSLFVSNMSHEIRTPMNAILGFAQILERDPSLTPRQAAHVRAINRGGRYLLRLINDILDIARIESGKTVLKPAAFSLQDLLADLEMMFRSRDGAEGLELIVERDETLPPHILADEGKLRQVLVNLMGNALKFTETGGVALRVRSEPVEAGPDEDWSPHAVLMDMRMPVMDGYEATRRIKALEEGRDTPVIAVTASAFKDSEEEVLATGVSAYLRKPFRPEELYGALEACLDLHFVYAEEPFRDASRPERPVLAPESLSALPKDRVTAMGRAVEQGDMGRLRELIDGVETLNPAAAAGLRALAEAYDSGEHLSRGAPPRHRQGGHS